MSSLLSTIEGPKLGGQFIQLCKIGRVDDLDNFIDSNSEISEVISVSHEGFYAACEVGRTDIIQLLLLAKHDKFLRNSNFLFDRQNLIGTGMVTAARAGRFWVIDFLVKYATLNDALDAACQISNISLITSYIGKGAKDLNRGFRSACAEGNTDIANLLIKFGANDFDGGLAVAYDSKKHHMVPLMVACGATNLSTSYAYPTHKHLIMQMLDVGIPLSSFIDIMGNDKMMEAISKKREMLGESLKGIIMPEVVMIIKGYTVL